MSEVIIIYVDVENSILGKDGNYCIDFNWDFCTGAVQFDNKKDLNMGVWLAKEPSGLLPPITAGNLDTRKLPIDFIKKYHGMRLPVQFCGKNPKGELILVIDMIQIDREIKLKDILNESIDN